MKDKTTRPVLDIFLSRFVHKVKPLGKHSFSYSHKVDRARGDKREKMTLISSKLHACPYSI
jgi:hypothetical protein